MQLFTLTNKHGIEVKITNYGGIIVAITTPDRQARRADIVLGFDRLADYEAGHPYFGAIVGRYANRIANGQFNLDGHAYKLAINNGPNHLHGGLVGFDKVLWQVSPQPGDRGRHENIRNSLTFTHTSQDGNEGYPGTLAVTVIYTLTDDNALRIDYRAEVDRATVINLTNHTYFNLTGFNLTSCHQEGAGASDVLGHMLTIHADRFTPVTAALIPTGDLQPVAGTPLDFREPHMIGARIADQHPQIQYAGGYDHNFVLNGPHGTLRLAAEVCEPKSGRTLEVWTTQPGVQFYTGNFLDGRYCGKGAIAYKKHYGFCLETQHFPDSPNQPRFPTVTLRPGAVYEHTTIYKFGIME